MATQSEGRQRLFSAKPHGTELNSNLDMLVYFNRCGIIERQDGVYVTALMLFFAVKELLIKEIKVGTITQVECDILQVSVGYDCHPKYAHINVADLGRQGCRCRIIGYEAFAAIN